jgi:hypothetical protein
MKKNFLNFSLGEMLEMHLPTEMWYLLQRCRISRIYIL